MRFYVDNATNLLIPGPNQRGSVATAGAPIAVMGGIRTPVELQFVDVDAATQLQVPVRKPVDWSIYWLLKKVGDFENPVATASVLSFTRPATDDGFYRGYLNLNNAAVKTALNLDGVTGNDLPSVTLAGELNFKDPLAAEPDKTAQHLYLLVQDWYAQGDEGVPDDGDPVYPMPSDLVTNGSLASILGRVKTGSTAIPNGQSYVVVAFDEPFDDDTWRFQGLIVQKTSGTPGNLLPGLVTVKSPGGFTIQLTGDTDATGYTLEWNVTTQPASGFGFVEEAPTGAMVYGRKGDGTWQVLNALATGTELSYASDTLTVRNAANAQSIVLSAYYVDAGNYAEFRLATSSVTGGPFTISGAEAGSGVGKLGILEVDRRVKATSLETAAGGTVKSEVLDLITLGVAPAQGFYTDGTSLFFKEVGGTIHRVAYA